ncbi:S-layer homology domain-containing protein [Parageobacillus toebii]|uniref:S-layer homology domain-containing protein n=1 Tax=Parageobacillus toebii TaxID=153151 RepID=UPI002814995B|nr:S-layer homology domain-containing protein [Parageobacillus toebii]WMT19862.1 S-layer homology domain-containing protein [Parageobacillus toebii]
MAYQPKSYRKFLAGSVSAALVASAVGPVVANAASFSDVDPNSTHGPNILALAEKGYIKGFEDGTFKPFEKISRGQAAKIFARILTDNGFQAPEKLEQAFDDVPLDAKDQELVKAAAIVKAAGVMTGSEGKLNPASNITRQQMAKVIVETFDLEKPADFKSQITDLDKADDWAREYIQTLEANGVTVVKEYRPKDNVTRGEFATFIKRAMDASGTVTADDITAVKFVDENTLEVTFNGELKDVKAEDFKIEGVEIESVSIKAAAAAEAKTTVVVIKTKTKLEEGKSYTISYKGQTSEKAKVEVPVITPKVESVSANNRKTVTIKFNKELDKDTITSDTLKVFEGTNTSPTVVDSDLSDGFTAGAVNYQLSADKKSVTIVFESTIAQSQELRIVVDGVKTVDGKTVEKYDNKVTVVDTTIPTIEGIKVNNAKSFEIQFSEPVNISAPVNQVLSNIKVDGNAVIGTLSQDFTKNTVTVTLATPLTAGKHDIKVYDVKDFNGLKAEDKTFSVDITQDTTPPAIVSAKVVSKDTIEIETSEQLDDLGTIKVGNNVATVTRVEGSLTKYRLTGFGNLDLSAVVEVTLKYKDQTDAVGNKVTTEQTFTFKAVDDTTLPTVTAQLLNQPNKKNYVKLTFSKPMQTTAGTIKVLKADGTLYKTISVSSVAAQFNQAKTELELTAADLGLTNTDVEKYKLEISDMKDNTIRENLLAKTTLEITTVDTKAPTVADKYVVTEGTTTDGDTVTITFSEPMDEATLSNLSNFTYNGTVLSAISGAKLQSISADKKSVTFVIPNARAGANMTVYAVKDANGNLLSGVQTIVKATAQNSGLALAGNGAADVVATSSRTVKVKVNTPLKTVDPSTFVLYKNGQPDVTFVNAVLDSKDSTNQTIVLTTNKDLDANADVYTLYTTATPTLTKNVYGNSFAPSTLLQVVKDEIAPEIKSVKAGNTISDVSPAVSADEFTIEFTEPVTATGTTLLDDLIVKKSDGTLLVPGTDYTIATTDNGTTATNDDNTAVDGDTKVVIKLADGLFVDGDNTISVAVAAPRNVKDGSANLLKEFAATTVTVKYVNDAPAAPSVTFSFDGPNAGQLQGATTAHEYSLDGGATWKAVTSANQALTAQELAAITDTNDIKIRVKASGYAPAGQVQTIDITKPAAPQNVVADATNGKITGLTANAKYEYKIGNGNWVAATADTNGEITGLTLNAGDSVQVRLAATETKLASDAATVIAN